MSNPSRQTMVLYREENTKLWFRATAVNNLEFEMSHRDGITAVFECSGFGNLPSGALLGELLTVQTYEHSIDMRYASKALFEYTSGISSYWVRANARIAKLPVVPVEWKHLVLTEHHLLHYTGQASDMNVFLELISQGQLYLENGRILGSQAVLPLQSTPINPDRVWGRKVAQSTQPRIAEPGKSWFEKFFRRA